MEKANRGVLLGVAAGLACGIGIASLLLHRRAAPGGEGSKTESEDGAGAGGSMCCGSSPDSTAACCGALCSSEADMESKGGKKKIVREAYAARARDSVGCCGSGASTSRVNSRAMGYSDADVQKHSEDGGANLGEGCGNPISFANLSPGETVLDLGAGAGFDCLLAADKVKNDAANGSEQGGAGKTQDGTVIGVDMTPEMIDRARKNAKEQGYTNVEFRLGEIENLPVKDNSIDVVLSNCVINLAEDKRQVYSEVYRVLKPGGRIAICDVISRSGVNLPDNLRTAQALAC